MNYFSKKKQNKVVVNTAVFLSKIEKKLVTKFHYHLVKTYKKFEWELPTKAGFFTKLMALNCIKINNIKNNAVRSYFIFKLSGSSNKSLLQTAIFFNFLEKNYESSSLSNKTVSSSYLNVKMSINDYFFSSHSTKKWNKNSRWYSMEEIISHFIFYSEGFSLPSGFSYGSVEAPKGHLGVSMLSQNSNKPSRARIKSSIQNMMGQVTQLVEGTSLGDFVVIVSGSYIVVGEVDR